MHRNNQAETAEFLRSLVIGIKPDLVALTGPLLDADALAIADALKSNGRGKLVSSEENASGADLTVTTGEHTEQELRRLVSATQEGGVIVILGAAPKLPGRETALAMEREGIISMLLLPIGGGVALIQKRGQKAGKHAGSTPAERALGGIIQPY